MDDRGSPLSPLSKEKYLVIFLNTKNCCSYSLLGDKCRFRRSKEKKKIWKIIFIMLSVSLSHCFCPTLVDQASICSINFSCPCLCISLPRQSSSNLLWVSPILPNSYTEAFVSYIYICSLVNQASICYDRVSPMLANLYTEKHLSKFTLSRRGGFPRYLAGVADPHPTKFGFIPILQIRPTWKLRIRIRPKKADPD